MAAYALSYLVGLVVLLYFLYRHTSLFSRGPYDTRYVELLSFSIPLMFSTLLGNVLAKIDTLLVGVFRSSSAAGTYDIAYSTAMLLMMVLMSVDYLFLPTFSEYHSNGAYQKARSFYQTITKWVFFGTLPLFFGMFLFPTFVISFAFGSSYSGGAVALQIVALAFTIHSFVGPNSGALTAYGYSKFILATDVLAATSNVLLNVVLIPLYGIEGAAFATLVSFSARNLTQTGWLYWQQDITPFSRGMIWPAAASIVTMAGLYAAFVSTFSPSVASLLGLLLVAGALYPVVIVSFGGVGEEELVIVDAIEDRFDLDLDRVRDIAKRLQ